MAEISLEEAVKQSCQALLAGDLMRVAGDFTPEALGALVASAAGITDVPSLMSYAVRSTEPDGEDQVVRLAFQTSEGEVTAQARWREIDGAWKITALTVAGL